MEMIPLDKCVDRHVYRLRGRNLEIGVYAAKECGFIGVREKFGTKFLDVEYHQECGLTRGVTRPIEDIGVIPGNMELVDYTTEHSDELLNILIQFTDNHTTALVFCVSYGDCGTIGWLSYHGRTIPVSRLEVEAYAGRWMANVRR